MPASSCCQAVSQGHAVGRCSTARRAERAIRAGTVIRWARTVAVAALAWKPDASEPAARVRLNATAARTSHAEFAANFPDGRCARGAVFEVGDDLFDDRVAAVGGFGLEHG